MYISRCPDQNPPVKTHLGQKPSSSSVVGQNPHRTKPPLGQNTSLEKHTRSKPPSLPLNQMQPLVCNAVVLKVRIMYVHNAIMQVLMKACIGDIVKVH